MLKPKHPGELMDRMKKGESVTRRKVKSAVKAVKQDMKADKKVAEKLQRLKPKGAKGKAQVKKLGRTFKTGGFAKIAKTAGKKYRSKEVGKKIAGKIFQKMARAHAAKAKK